MSSSHTHGVSASNTYDSLNRLSAVVDGHLGSGANTTTYTYDSANNVAKATLPNGVESTLTYDSMNRITSLESAVSGYGYYFDATGKRTEAVELSGRTINWSYDGINRLTNEAVTGAGSGHNGTVGYTLDPVGNRPSDTSSLSGVTAGSAIPDADDRLSTETYDSNGNVTATGGKTFAYDSENHLTSMNSGAVTIVYDGDGNRVAKTVGGVTTHYLVDNLNPTGYAQVVEEVVSGAVTREYTYGLQRINENQVISSTWTPSFYGYDGGGTVRQLTDTTGAITDTYDYDAFGNLVNQTGSTPNSYLYRAEQYDSDLGLYYLRARYYNQITGRFMGRDPVDRVNINPATLHKYLYAGGDPVNAVDPTGRALFDTALVTGGSVVGPIEASVIFVGGSASELAASVVGEFLAQEAAAASVAEGWAAYQEAIWASLRAKGIVRILVCDALLGGVTILNLKLATDHKQDWVQAGLIQTAIGMARDVCKLL